MTRPAVVRGLTASQDGSFLIFGEEKENTSLRGKKHWCGSTQASPSAVCAEGAPQGGLSCPSGNSPSGGPRRGSEGVGGEVWAVRVCGANSPECIPQIRFYCLPPQSCCHALHGNMTTACGRSRCGSDSPPDCHSLPQLRFAYPHAYAQGSLWCCIHASGILVYSQHFSLPFGPGWSTI